MLTLKSKGIKTNKIFCFLFLLNKHISYWRVRLTIQYFTNVSTKTKRRVVTWPNRK